MTRKQFGSMIQTARLKAGLSQGELAEKANVPAWATAQIETGRAVGPEKAKAISDQLGLTPPEKFSPEPAKKKQLKYAASPKNKEITGEAMPLSTIVAMAFKIRDAMAELKEEAAKLTPGERSLVMRVLEGR